MAMIPNAANAIQDASSLTVADADSSLFVVNIGWVALASWWTISIALVVWGRNGF